MKNSIQLSVNLNKIAWLRNARDESLAPILLNFVEKVFKSPCVGVTVHPRPDERHITYQDLLQIADFRSKFYPEKEVNIEGNPFVSLAGEKDFIETIALFGENTQCTLVPDHPEQKTSDHGWQLRDFSDRLKDSVNALKDKGIRVSIFVDPKKSIMDQALQLGVDRVEIYTGPFAKSFSFKSLKENNFKEIFLQYREAYEYARSLGLAVNAGHDLSLENLPTFIECMSPDEVSIGQALIADALTLGFDRTLESYLSILKGGV